MILVDWVMKLTERIIWVDVLISFGIFAIFLVFRKLFTTYIFSFFIKKFSRSERAVLWAQSFEKPLRIFFIILGVYLAVKYVISLNWEARLSVDHFFRSLVIILAGWGTYNISASSSGLLEGMSRKFGLDDTSMLIPFLSKVLRSIVIILVITLVGSEWGFSINGLVAGMGLGSLAIALAAKDTLGNIFGGIVVILEKPFSKGDWILTPNVEGVVEDITFRSTQIRTFADAVVTVPNASLVDHPITNWSKMEKRRISFTLGVALDSDRERLASAIAGMEKMLLHHDSIDPGTIMVKFSEFNESSLGIFFYFFTKTTVWSDYLTVRQEINLLLMEILEEEGVQLAYPSHRVFMEEAAFSGQKLAD